MSKRLQAQRSMFGKTVHSLRADLTKAQKNLEHNIVVIESELRKIKNAELKLISEKERVSNKIEHNVEELKERIDAFAAKMHGGLDDVYQANMTEIKRNRENLETKLASYAEDISKCKDVLEAETIKTEFVSERKVLQMVYDTVDLSRFGRLDMIVVCSKRGVEEIALTDATLEAIFGRFENHIETLDEYSGGDNEIPKKAKSLPKSTLTLANSFKCQDLEITAISCASGTAEAWVCFDAGTELVKMNEHKGETLTSIKTNYRIDDLVVAGRRIFVTSPDSSLIRNIQLDVNDRLLCSKNIESDIYIHGICLSFDGSKFAVCGTNSLNYSGEEPTQTSIIEFSFKGVHLETFPILGYNGKVYRIAHNRNNDYILTFPKERRVLSVTGNGSIRASYRDLNSGSDQMKNQEITTPKFWPSGVTCDLRGRIFVTDWFQKRVLLLDENCKFLMYVGETYTSPNALAIDQISDKLWLGDKGCIEIWNT